jgi:hypothetical protein
VPNIGYFRGSFQQFEDGRRKAGRNDKPEMNHRRMVLGRIKVPA